MARFLLSILKLIALKIVLIVGRLWLNLKRLSYELIIYLIIKRFCFFWSLTVSLFADLLHRPFTLGSFAFSLRSVWSYCCLRIRFLRILALKILLGSILVILILEIVFLLEIILNVYIWIVIYYLNILIRLQLQILLILRKFSLIFLFLFKLLMLWLNSIKLNRNSISLSFLIEFWIFLWKNRLFQKFRPTKNLILHQIS